jgi:phospholipid/cholesterol/gamma-HCH transport system substrate-binding protein
MRGVRDMPNWTIGLIAVAVTVFGFYLAFAKSLPFTGDGYQLRAVFDDAQNIRANSPVRIAGVDVGEVTGVEHLVDANGNGQDAAVVTMRIDEDARPIREDATLALRPRLFLEGNLFVDMQPGSPGAEELGSGSVIPLEQTQVSVQFDEVLTSLQKPVRDDLQLFLKEFGGALDRHGGAEGFREVLRSSPPAYRYTAEVNEALLGTEPGDLAGVVRNFGDLAGALSRDRAALQDLVTNLRIFSGSFAAEREALEQGIAELPRVLEVGRPALAKLNSGLPALRAFSREILPGVRTAERTLDETTPFIGQLRRLVSKPELRGLVKDLRPTIPDLARLAKTTVPFFEQTRALSSCFNGVVIPWSNTDVPSDAHPDAGPVYKNTGYSLTGVSGESRSGDANGQYFRVLGGGGTNTFRIDDVAGLGDTVGVTPFNIEGAQPAKQSSAKTPFRPDVPCETQEPPDLRSNVADPPEQSSTGQAAGWVPPEIEPYTERYTQLFEQMMRADLLEQNGRLRQANELRRKLRDDLARFSTELLPDYRRTIAELTGGGG